MHYVSTRNASLRFKASEAIVRGISDDGGLFVPSIFPCLHKEEILKMFSMKYYERAAFVLSKFLVEFTYEELCQYTKAAYGKFYGEPFPYTNVRDNINILELWHGPTAAFKDAALALLPYLLVVSKKKINEKSKTLILVATSGDTGKAALEGFKDVEDTNIIVLYPSTGVSSMQKLQMITQEGDNVYVAAIEGNFDDAQSAVKEIFADTELKLEFQKKGYKLSSANSINWGRLVPQIVYYVSSYVDLLKDKKINYGDFINVCVPTGNFGNILAAYYAKKMGLPIDKFICASNENNILTDFFNEGEYDANRVFHKTMSPSMDILVSSNLERLLFEIFGRDDQKVREKMNNLRNKKVYNITIEEKNIISKEFYGNFATENETLQTIYNYEKNYKYLLDTHTAVAVCVYEKYVDATKDNKPVIIASTANPYKFPCDVYTGVTGKKEEDSFKAMIELNKITNVEIPKPLQGLENKKVRFDKVYANKAIKEVIKKYIEG